MWGFSTHRWIRVSGHRALSRKPVQVSSHKRSRTVETMMAVRAHERGGPEALRYEEAARPVAGNGEVLVEVHAAAVTPGELLG